MKCNQKVSFYFSMVTFYFSADNKDHLILQSQKNKNIIYVSYHSKEDPLTPANFKELTMQILKILG
ncbi:TPA: DUF2920 family protein, partial [Campylobacter jejuni]